MDIQESLDRILHDKESLTDLFYRAFLDRHPEARAYFDRTNLLYQSMNLTIALMVIVKDYTRSSRTTEMYLNYLGTKHHDRGVPQEMYPKFRDALLATLGQFHDKDWTPELAAQWQEVFDRASEKMFVGYHQHFHV